jgi:hypothetical protein
MLKNCRRKSKVLPDFADCRFHHGNGAKIGKGDFDKLGPKVSLFLFFVEVVHYCKGFTEGARLRRAAVMRPGVVAQENLFDLFLFPVHVLSLIILDCAAFYSGTDARNQGKPPLDSYPPKALTYTDFLWLRKEVGHHRK